MELTNLPVSRLDMMMLESSDPLITIELSSADVTQLTGAMCSLGTGEIFEIPSKVLQEI